MTQHRTIIRCESIPEELIAAPARVPGRGDGEDATGGAHFPAEECRTYRRRWYVLALFSVLCCLQDMVWNTYGPIQYGVLYAYPTWTNATLALIQNWANIMFVIFVAPVCWLQEKIGLRQTTLLVCGMMAFGAVARVLSTDPELFTISSHLCGILNGITGIVVMAATGAVSAAWFPINERTTATSISQMSNSLGNGLTCLLGPYLVPDTFLNKSILAKAATGPRCPDNIDFLVAGYNATFGPDKEVDWDGDGYDDFDRPSPPSRQEMRQLVWRYNLGLASVSTVLFLTMLFYFPSKPPLPPSPSASSHIHRAGFSESLRLMLKDTSVMLCVVGFAVSIGVQGTYAGVMPMNFEPLGVDDKTVGYMGALIAVISMVVAVVVAQVTDHIRKHMKVTLIGILFLTTLSYIWQTLIVSAVLPNNVNYLFISTVVGGALVTVCQPLFFEYTIEMCYPVTENMAGGLLTGAYNLVGVLFLCLFFIKNIGFLWMNYALVGSVASGIFFLLLTKERYKRMDVDNGEPSPEIHQTTANNGHYVSPYDVIG